MTRLTRLFILGLSLGFLLLVDRVDGSIINGSFENGMAGWASVGPNSAVPDGTINGYNATSGSEYAFLNTGIGAQSVATQDIVLGSIGIGPGYIASNFPNAMEGSLLFQIFTLDLNCNTLNFDWNFLTNETPPSQAWNDFAFAHLFDSGMSLTNSVSLDTFSAFPGSGGPEFSHSTGWQSVSFTGLTGGNTDTLVFGVFDAGDTVVDSALLIDNVHCVPEPGSVTMLGLAGLAFLRMRRRPSC